MPVVRPYAECVSTIERILAQERQIAAAKAETRESVLVR